MMPAGDSLTVVILCAGCGSRFGCNKMLVLLDGMPLFLHSVRTFLPMATQLILVVSSQDRSLFEKALNEFGYGDNEKLSLVDGGTERTFSVQAALGALRERDGIVAIHDGARPFATQALLLELVSQAREHGGAAPGKPVTDTMMRAADDETVAGVVPREKIWRIATPQVFRLKELTEAYSHIGQQIFTDDTQVFMAFGGTVKLVRENFDNLKVTYPEDLDKASLMIRSIKKDG